MDIRSCEECSKRYDFSKKNGCSKKVCSSCQVNRRRWERRTKIVEYLGGECDSCGYSKCYGVLEAHHIDPATKSFSISGNTTRKWESIREELDKCVLLCANCHRESHHNHERYGCPGT